MKCRGCGEDRAPDGFYVRKSGRSAGYVTQPCKRCTIAAQSAWSARKGGRREYSREYYLRHSERWVAYRRDDNNRHGARRAFVAMLKANPCMDCGLSLPIECMDFDHRGEKVTDVSKMINGRHTEEALVLELQKCDLVCANCHRIRTARRRRK